MTFQNILIADALLPFVLLLLYPLAVQYLRGGWWRVLAPLTLFTLILDAIANYTILAVLTWDWPRQGERTFSVRLQRLVFEIDWRGTVARMIARYLNLFDPTHNHVVVPG